MKTFRIIEGENLGCPPEEEIKILLGMTTLSKKTTKYLHAYIWYVNRGKETKKDIISFKEYKKLIPFDFIPSYPTPLSL